MKRTAGAQITLQATYAKKVYATNDLPYQKQNGP